MLAERIRQVQSGDPFHQHRRRPLIEHLAEFEAHLVSKNRTSTHVRQTLSRVRSALEGCGFHRLVDLDADRVSSWLAHQRDAGQFGITTSNGYITALKMFGKWLLTSRRLPSNPFVSLSALNARVDRRHVRRTLSHAEFSRLLSATRARNNRFAVSTVRPAFTCTCWPAGPA